MELSVIVGLNALNGGLNPLYGKEQFGMDMVEQMDGSPLVIARIGVQHPQPGTVINRGVLEVLFRLPGLSYGLEELHIHLQFVHGALRFITLPPGLSALVALRDRQSAVPGLMQNLPYPKTMTVTSW